MRDSYSALKECPIVLSYSIYTTKNALGIFTNKKNVKIVGGYYLNNALDVPTGDDSATKIRDVIDSLNDKNNGKKEGL